MTTPQTSPATGFSLEAENPPKTHPPAIKPPESTTVDYEPEPPKKKCAVKDILPESVIPLVKAAPNNETIRNLLLAHCKVPVPAEADDWDKIKKWIEYNVVFSKPPTPKTRSIEDEYAEIQRREEERRRNQVDVDIIATDRERGTCSYSVDVRGEGGMPVDRNDLVDFANDSDDAEDFWGHVVSDMHDTGVGDHVSMETVDNTEDTGDHQCDDSDGISVEITEAGKQALKDALRTLNREQFDRLFPNG